MLGRILGVIGKLLIVAGLLVLGFVGYQLWGTGLETARGQSQLTDELAIDAGTPTSDDQTIDVDDLADALAAQNPATAPPTAAPPEGNPIGIITIDRIDVQHVVVEGVSKADLKKGPGHYPGTPLPGQAGNAGIAGHRTTYGAPFNRIDELVPGDEIVVATPQGEFTYDVIPAPDQPANGQAWYTVTPDQVDVLTDKGDNRLTLTACHPKYSAKQRIIVNAVLRSPVAPTKAEPAAAESARVDEAAQQFDQGLEGDPDALPMVLVFGAAAAAVAALAWFLSRFTRRWVVYAVATPAILVLIWFGYVYMDRYLPAI